MDGRQSNGINVCELQFSQFTMSMTNALVCKSLQSHSIGDRVFFLFHPCDFIHPSSSRLVTRSFAPAGKRVTTHVLRGTPFFSL